MRVYNFPILSALVCALGLAQTHPSPKIGKYGDIPLAFEENRGQVNRQARFLLRGGNLNLFVTDTGAVLALQKGNSHAAVRLEVAGASGQATVAGESLLPAQSSYFRGNDPAKWITGVPQYSKVRIEEVRRGVDLICYGNEKQFEYDLVVKPGTMPADVRLRFTGAEKTWLTPDGDLKIQTAAGDLIQHKPRVWQQSGTARETVQGRYEIAKNGEVSLVVGRYDRTRDLVIDPIISYSTYLGGLAYDQASAIAVDAAGNTYITGKENSPDFPTTVGAFSVKKKGSTTNAFIAKFNPSGTSLLYSTYIGGSNADTGTAIAIDSSGNAYITGSAGSIDFPVTPGSFQTRRTSYAYPGVFVTKLNASGTALVFSTYLGGSFTEKASGIQVDSAGSAYVAGATWSTDFPTTSGAFAISLPGLPSAFVTKLNPTGTQLVYSTYLGGSVSDSAAAIAIDSSNQAYVVGIAYSSNFPTTAGSYQASFKAGFSNAFVTHLSSDGTKLIASTYLGGGDSSAVALALDSNNNPYVIGTTSSPSFPTTPNAYSAASASPYSHPFITKLNSALTNLFYSTYLGGSNMDAVAAIAVDAGGNAYVTGSTTSLDFPISPGSFFNQKNPLSSQAAFLSEFNPAGSSLTYSTLLGGTGSDTGTGVVVDANLGVYVTGYTSSNDFPITPGAYQTVLTNGTGSSTDVFVTKLNLTSPVSCNLSISPASYVAPLTGGTSSFSITLPQGCPWVLYNPISSITFNGPTHGFGSATVSFNISSNATSSLNVSSGISIGSTLFSITQPAGSCYMPLLTPASATFGPSGAFGRVAVAVPSTCQITATTDVPWITGITTSYSYPGTTVQYFVGPNTSAARTGTLNIAGQTFTVTQQAGITSVPAVVSVSPNAGSISSQVFTAVYSDTVGAAALNRRLFLINSSLNGVGGCFVQTDNTGIYLVNDAGSGLLGPLTGASSTFSNSQCTLDLGGTGVTNSGNNSTVTLSLFFLPRFAGAKTIYMYTEDSASNTGFQPLGSFTVPAPATPATVSVVPYSASGARADFVATYSDASGASYINRRLLLINSSLTGAGACFVQADQNGVYLVNDAGSGLLGPVTLNSSVTNSQCTLNGITTSRENISGATTTAVRADIDFKAAFVGPKNIYMYADDALGNNSGFQLRGTYSVFFGNPTADSVTPAAASGTTQTFTAIYSNPSGAAAFNRRLFVINSSLNGAGACFVQTDPSGIYLVNDAGSGLLGPIAGSNTFANSQCTLNGTGTGVVNSGNGSTVTLSITFKSAFAGAKNIYMYAEDTNGSNSGFQTRGTYTVAFAVPTADSVTPSAASGTAQTFTATYSDASGGAALNRRLFLIASSLNGAGACFVQADPTGIYLVNDADSALLGPVAAGGTASNNQCTLNGTGSSVVNSGTGSTVILSIAFKPAFAGTKNVYMYADDAGGNNSGFQTRGTYSVSGTPSVPTNTSVTPNSGSGANQTFTLVYSDAAGNSLLNRRLFLINSILNGTAACLVQVDATGIYLANDADSAIVGPLVANSSLTNSQCTLNGAGASVSNSATSTTVVLPVTFKPSFGGSRNLYMYADDTSGNNSGWQQMGVITSQ